MSHPEQPSYAELAARNAELTARVSELLAVVAEQAALIEELRAEVAALRRQAGRDSSNSSQPPSQDSPAAEAKAKAARRAARRARPARPQSGQKGHPGANLAWTARPDEIRVHGASPSHFVGLATPGSAEMRASHARIPYAPSRISLTVATIVNSALSFVSAACRAMLLCLVQGILLTFLVSFLGAGMEW